MLASLMYDTGVKRACKVLNVLITTLEDPTSHPHSAHLDSIRTLMYILRDFTQHNVIGLRQALKGRMLGLFARLMAVWLPRHSRMISLPAWHPLFDYDKVNLVNFTVLCAA